MEWSQFHILIDRDINPEKYFATCSNFQWCAAHMPPSEELRLAFSIVPNANHQSFHVADRASFEGV